MEARYQPQHLEDNRPPWLFSAVPSVAFQDFVLYIMVGHTHVFGRKPTMREREKDRERERKGKRPLKVETFLSAPDLLTRHLLVRRDSAVPGTPTGQGINSYHENKHQACLHVLQKLISLCRSSDAALQRRFSHTQRSGHLQGDGPQTRRRDRHGGPFSLPIPWPPCDSRPATGLDAAVAGRHCHHLLSLRVGGQTRSTETVSGIYRRGPEVPSLSCWFSAAGEAERDNSCKFICSNSLVYTSVSLIFLLGDNLQKFLSGLWWRTFSSCLSPVADDRSCLQTPGSGPHTTDTAQVGQFD